jgi:hypothetical protein
VPSRSARRRHEAGAFLGWAELRSLVRKPLICRALCRSIPSVTNQSPAGDRGCRIALFDRDRRASKARTCAGEGSNRLFRDVKAICRGLFILTTLPRRQEVGRRPGKGEPPQRAPNNEEVPIGPTGAVKVNFASAHAVRTPSALSLYLLQWCVF